jgi:serine/threonine protein kinase
MEPDRWRRVKAIFDAAVEEPHAEARAALLDGECAGDAGLRREVETLLESHGRAESFLETPAAGLQTAGMLLGAYRLLERTGEGGSAEVFRAERADGHFHKQVAVKVLRAGIYGDDARRRFRRERQVLAELDHPNIVRLWDGGIAPDGRPYLVEDYLEGPPITVLAGRQGLDRAARVRLLLPVCDALAYAHGRGVVHRDLKPGNILTTADGTPKLVDFGIAGFGVPGGDAQTLTQTRFWTPEYASPEQARGEIPGRGSDIYSICVVLYELLLDRQPYQVRDLGLVETIRVICEREPDFSGLALRRCRGAGR